MVTVLWLKDLAERVGRTALQAVITAVLLSDAFDLGALRGLVFVGIAAGLAVLTEGIRALLAATPRSNATPWSRPWLIDAGERLGLTFLQAFLAALLARGNYDLTGAHAAVLAGVAAGLSLLMSMFALPVDDTITPASFVKGTPVQRAAHRA
jgi:hypothetical protein